MAIVTRRSPISLCAVWMWISVCVEVIVKSNCDSTLFTGTVVPREYPELMTYKSFNALISPGGKSILSSSFSAPRRRLNCFGFSSISHLSRSSQAPSNLVNRASRIMAVKGAIEDMVFMGSGKHENSVIWMHGLGDTGRGWADLPQHISSNIAANTKFIFPTAPMRPVTLNGNAPCPAWFDVYELSESSEMDSKGLLESAARITALIDKEINELHIEPSRVIVGGFSQGAALAYTVGLRYPKRLGGILALSGWLPLLNEYPAKLSEEVCKAGGLKILHCHGIEDPLVKVNWGKDSVGFLKDQLGFKQVEIKLYNNLGHSVNAAVFADTGNFLNDVLKH